MGTDKIETRPIQDPAMETRQKCHKTVGQFEHSPQMFCQTQWPSPEEYSQLEVQTNMGRTDIVRWFKDHRSALKNGETPDWMESVLADQQKAGQQQNGPSSEKHQSVLSEAKAERVDPSTLCSAEEGGGNEATVENSKLSNQDKEQRLAGRLAEGVTDLSRNGQDQNSSGDADKGRWIKVTVNVGEESEGGVERPRLGVDSDGVTLEQSGRVTG